MRFETNRNTRKQLGSETAYLLRSPKNAQRLKAALGEAKRGLGKRESIEYLRKFILKVR